MSQEIDKVIVDLFETFKTNTNDTAIHFNKEIIGYSQQICEHISFINFLDNTQRYDAINKVIFDLKEAITIYHSNISTTLINSDTYLEELVSYFDKSHHEIQIISLIFNPIVEESVSKNSDLNTDSVNLILKKYYFKSFLENIIIKFNGTFNIKLSYYISKVRSEITKSKNVTKISFCKKNNISVSIEELLTETLINTYKTVENTLHMLNEIDSLTNNIGSGFNSFKQMYSDTIHTLYNVRSNAINSLCDTDIRPKLYQINMILITESFIHDSLFNDPDIFKNILNNDILSLNSAFIVNLFNKQIKTMYKDVNKVLNDIYENQFDLDVFLTNIFDSSIPSFINLYYTLYNYNQESSTQICEEIINQIIISLERSNDGDLVFMFLTYLFLKILEDELMFNFTPTDRETPEARNATSYIMNKRLHDVFSNKIKQIPPEKIASFIITFSQKEIIEKAPTDIKLISEAVNKITTFYESGVINEISKYIVYNIKDKDAFEEIYSKLVCKKILNGSIVKYDIKHLDTNIQDISTLETVCLHVNRKILQSYENGIHLSNEYNILFQNDQFQNDQFGAGLNLKLFPEGISHIVKFEYKDTDFMSPTFKTYLTNKKDTFMAYFMSKYEGKLLTWSENTSTFDLSYTIGTILIDFRVDYKQADILFLMQNEYYALFYKIKSYSGDTFINKDNEHYIKFIEMDRMIKTSKFVTFLIDKRIFKIESTHINHLIRVDLVVFNKNNIKRTKKFDFYKINLKDDMPINIMEPKRKEDLTFFRSDYVQSAIIRRCKSHKEQFINEVELFKYVSEKVNKRFEIEKPLFAKSLEKLINLEYIEKMVVNDTMAAYKYLS